MNVNTSITPPKHNIVNSIGGLVKRLPEAFGDKVLFRYYCNRKELAEMTYRQFYEKSACLAASLESMGLGGKRIAVVGDSCPEWVMTYIAVLSVKSIIVPLDKELATEELFNFLERSKADAIVFTKQFCDKFKDRIISNEKKLIYIPIVCEDEALLECENVFLFNSLLDDGLTAVQNGYEITDYEINDDMREMLFTSGTTGTSKCVMLSERNVVSCINSACATVDFSSDDVIVSVLPLHHTYELAVMMAAINIGATICINDSLKYVLRNFKEFKPTGLVLVPLFVNTMYKKIMDEAKKTNQLKKLKIGMKASSALLTVGIDIRKKLFSTVLDAFGGRLNKIVCGGAALNPAYADAFKAFGVNVYEGYGITECSPLISVNPYQAPKRGSVGPSVPSCTVKIDGKDKNNHGFIEGEILVKGENVMLGYYENEEATKEVFTEDGYFRTGDIGYMDNDGYIYITGRKKSVIVLENGKNVFPEEIEEYLSTIDTIAECVVVGRNVGENVLLTAIIYPAFDKFEDGTDLTVISQKINEQITQLNKKLPSFKQIRDIELRRNEFDKTTSRKIKRFLVK